MLEIEKDGSLHYSYAGKASELELLGLTKATGDVCDLIIDDMDGEDNVDN